MAGSKYVETRRTSCFVGLILDVMDESGDQKFRWHGLDMSVSQIEVKMTPKKVTDTNEMETEDILKTHRSANVTKERNFTQVMGIINFENKS